MIDTFIESYKLDNFYSFEEFISRYSRFIQNNYFKEYKKMKPQEKILLFSVKEVTEAVLRNGGIVTKNGCSSCKPNIDFRSKIWQD